MGEVSGVFARWIAPRLKRGAIRVAAALAFLSGLAAGALTDAFAPLEFALMDQRFETVRRKATGNLILIEIDAKSLIALETWPWPRTRHAALIDTLTRAGADRIAFDIDFSSPSVPENDAALAAAAKRAEGRLILPAFAQAESLGSRNDRTLSSEPIAILRPHALIGHVNIWPLGSQARTVKAGAYFGTLYRPAMAALVSDRFSQTMEERFIDFSIDPHSIPRLSYADVLAGTADLTLVRGRTALIGGTAIELGDRLPVPVFGVLPGVAVQALAAESMSQDRLITRTSGLVSLVLALLIFALLHLPILRGWLRFSIGAFSSAAVLFSAATALQVQFAISLDIVPALAAIGGALIIAYASDLADRARRLAQERARSAQRQAMIALVVEGSSDGILAVDDTGAIQICNEEAARIFGIPLEELTGQKIETFLPLTAEPFLAGANGARNRFNFEHSIARDGGLPALMVEVSVNHCLLKSAGAGQDGQDHEPFIVLTLRDVSARKRIEAAERAATEEKLIAERTKSLFIANMSHELRTPLNAIIGFSEILSAETLGKLGHPKYKEYVDIVQKSGSHLLDVVNGVLEVANLASGTVKLETKAADLAQITDAAVHFIRSSRDYRGQTITIKGFEASKPIQSDARLIKQILINLLSNAVKFNRPEVTAQITIALEAGDEQMTLKVIDNGCGISAEVLAQAGQAFYQGDASFTRRHEGRGLGLYLVKRHVALLGGTFTLSSEPGRGTEAAVTLPVDARGAETASPSPLRVAAA